MDELAMRLGAIKFFDDKGWGFITPGDGSDDVFFHSSELPGKRGERWIADGTEVTFELGTFNGRTTAKKVRPITPEPADASSGGSDGQQ